MGPGDFLPAEDYEQPDTKSSFRELAGALSKHYGLHPLIPLVRYLFTFRTTQKFLLEIWNRILKDRALHEKYWDIYIDLYDPSGDERQPTQEEAQILDEYKDHQLLLNLDLEDWFLHAHILMEQFSRVTREIMIILAPKKETAKQLRGINPKSLADHIDYFLTGKGKCHDARYSELLREASKWYEIDLKDVRDDLIQHDATARLWSTSLSNGKLKVSKVLGASEKLLKELYELRDKNLGRFPFLKDDVNFFSLLEFFEKNISKLEHSDAEKVKNIRKKYGRQLPDIPELQSKMNKLFRDTNDHFIGKLQEYCFAESQTESDKINA
jgi:hypothetical protein